jgi:hypothetical protein
MLSIEEKAVIFISLKNHLATTLQIACNATLLREQERHACRFSTVAAICLSLNLA